MVVMFLMMIVINGLLWKVKIINGAAWRIQGKSMKLIKLRLKYIKISLNCELIVFENVSNYLLNILSNREIKKNWKNMTISIQTWS